MKLLSHRLFLFHAGILCVLTIGFSRPVQAATKPGANVPVLPRCLSSSVTSLPKKHSGVVRVLSGFVGYLPVTMQLTQDKAGKEFMSGKYFYKQKKTCLYLDRYPAMDQGRLAFRETDSYGHVSGRWDVRYEHGILSGEWYQTVQAEPLHVLLYEVNNNLPRGRGITGSYRRLDRGLDGAAHIQLVLVDPQTVIYTGEADWVSPYNPDNVHTGEAEGALVANDLLKPLSPTFANDHVHDECVLAISKHGARLQVIDNNMCGGANVTFSGTYKRVGR